MIRHWQKSFGLPRAKKSRVGRTVVLKLEDAGVQDPDAKLRTEFSTASCEELTEIAPKLRERVELDARGRYRLVGGGLSNREAEETTGQPALFE